MEEENPSSPKKVQKTESYSTALRFSLGSGGIAPFRATSGSAGYDLSLPNGACTTGVGYDEYEPGKVYQENLMLHVEIPRGFCGILLPRSSLAKMYGMQMHPGVIDSDFRGSIQVLFSVRERMKRQEQMRIAQLIIVPVMSQFELKQVPMDEISKTERGEGGFGSTGV